VVDTIASSGTQFEKTDVECLVKRGAPAEVVAKAKTMLKPTEAAPPPVDKEEDESLDDAPPPSRFDQAEALGSGDASTDEEDEGSLSDCPGLDGYIEDQKVKKYQTAAEGLFGLLDKNACPSKDSTIKYYLGKSLHGMEMYHSAQHYYMEVVKKGPENPLFRHALPRLAAIAEYTGNDYELLRVVGKIAPEAYPRQSRPLLHYLMGRKSYETGDLSEAAAHFEQVPTEHALYPRAQYFEGIIFYEREKLKSSVKAFREVIRAEPAVEDDRVARDLENLKDLALINIGRIYFGLERPDNAEQYYAKVERDSTYWAESLFERAWVSFYQGDYNEALGMLLTVDSPLLHRRRVHPGDLLPPRALVLVLLRVQRGRAADEAVQGPLPAHPHRDEGLHRALPLR
jgi:TolA-binding protein